MLQAVRTILQHRVLQLPSAFITAASADNRKFFNAVFAKARTAVINRYRPVTDRTSFNNYAPVRIISPALLCGNTAPYTAFACFHL